MLARADRMGDHHDRRAYRQAADTTWRERPANLAPADHARQTAVGRHKPASVGSHARGCRQPIGPLTRRYGRGAR